VDLYIAAAANRYNAWPADSISDILADKWDDHRKWGYQRFANAAPIPYRNQSSPTATLPASMRPTLPSFSTLRMKTYLHRAGAVEAGSGETTAGGQG